MSKARPADNPYIDKVRASLAISGVRAPYVKRWSGGALRISFKYFQDASKVRDALATLNAHTASGVFLLPLILSANSSVVGVAVRFVPISLRFLGARREDGRRPMSRDRVESAALGGASQPKRTYRSALG